MLRKILIAVAVVLVAIQFVPYGREHANPPVTAEPRWNSEETRAVFERACADCHSHETRWPWYSHVAPASWLVQRDVDRGRSEFNVSIPGGGEEAHEAAEMVLEEKMPLRAYLVGHADARLSTEERKAFAVGLDATFGHGSGHGGDAGVGERSGYFD